MAGSRSSDANAMNIDLATTFGSMQASVRRVEDRHILGTGS